MSILPCIFIQTIIILYETINTTKYNGHYTKPSSGMGFVMIAINLLYLSYYIVDGLVYWVIKTQCMVYFVFFVVCFFILCFFILCFLLCVFLCVFLLCVFLCVLLCVFLLCVLFFPPVRIIILLILAV